MVPLDWMYNEFEGPNATLKSATRARSWLTQMGNAASKYGLGIQYCMSIGRFVLQSAEIDAVSNFRAGDDYGPGNTKKCGFPYCA